MVDRGLNDDENNLSDPDSLHYVRANSLSRYRSIKDTLSGEDRDDWLEWFEGALGDEIQYAADNRNATREDNAPETIAHEVITQRYGTFSTFEYALMIDPHRLSALGILNMLKDAAAAGLDSREEF